jgi:hypothetical protein
LFFFCKICSLHLGDQGVPYRQLSAHTKVAK